MNRRRFLSNLAFGAAALMLRFRPEIAREFAPTVIDSGEFGQYRWVLISAFRPVIRHDYVPIVIHRCPEET